MAKALGVENFTTPPYNDPQCVRSVDLANFFHGATLPAVLVIVVLAFLNKRRNVRQNWCNGRPGLTVPLNFLDGYNNRWAYAVAFGAAANSIVVVFFRGFRGGLAGVDSPTWATSFLFLIQVAEVTVDYYPFFACLTTPYKLVGSIIGFCLTLIWLVIDLIRLFECPRLPESQLAISLDVPFEGLILQWPATVCLFALAFKFGLMFWKAVRDRQFVVERKLSVAFPHQVTYVRCLFQRSHHIGTGTAGKTLWERYRYRSIPGFLYPSRFCCVVVVIVSLLYQIVFAYVFFVGRAYNSFIPLLEKSSEDLHPDISAFLRSLVALFKILRVWFHVATVLCILLAIFYLYFILRKYRIHMLKLYKGDRRFIHITKLHPPSSIVGSLRWGGYQIAYLCWGLVYSGLTMYFTGSIIITVVYFGRWDFILWIVEVFLAPMVVLLLIYFAQVLLSRFAFLQEKIKPTDKHSPLAVDNRKLYENTAYFMLIVNMGTGTFSSLRRLLLAMVIGLVTLGRMDRSPLQRGYETWDRGLQSYIGMLLVDYTHNHPVMRVFCKILTDHVHPPDTSCDELHDVVVSSLHREGPSNRPGKINFARKRWYLVYMLIKNPTLVQHRKGRLTRAPDVDAIEIEIPDKCSMSKYRQQVRDWICSKRSSTDPDADIQPYLSG